MIKILKELLGICDHKYGEPLHQGKITDRNGKTTGFFYDCRCEKCGDIRTFNCE